MDDLTCWKIRNKYKNIIFPRLAYLLINFLNDNHNNYVDLILSKYVFIDDIIYYLRNKNITSEQELIEWTIRYIELKHGIFEKSKS